ncbi:MAG: DUF4136 domain-containing protein [Xanthomonadales bacterium]|jgi:hypothetical protein|nr:DUF4136 domain-containing protein [Xanthomonadales bacterium]
MTNKSGLSLAASLAAPLLVLLLGACASGLEVRSDQDPNADFNQYRTWGFFEQLGIEGGYNSPVFGEHFRAAITQEMTARGYRQSMNPDLYINVTLRADDKVKMKSHTAPYMSGAYYQRPGGPYYGSAFGVGVGTVSRATEVTEASVFIDFVDNETDRLVWQGVAVAEADDKAAQRLRDAIFSAVESVFTLYPYTAPR